MDPIDLKQKLAAIDDLWTPKIVAALNDYHVKLARIEGDFVWHAHLETDELFMVIEGAMTLELWSGEGDPPEAAGDGAAEAAGVERLRLETGQLYVVPAGVVHRPVAERACGIVLIEPAGTPNTGTAEGTGRVTTVGEWV